MQSATYLSEPISSEMHVQVVPSNIVRATDMKSNAAMGPSNFQRASQINFNPSEAVDLRDNVP